MYLPHSEGLLAPLLPYLTDNEVSEILLNRPGEIFVERQGKFNCHTVPEFTANTLDMLFQLIANENAQSISNKQPLLSGNLLDGTRVQLVLPPVASNYTFSIRRKTVKHLTLDDYEKIHFYNQALPHTIDQSEIIDFPSEEKKLLELYQKQEWSSFIKKAIQLKKNIIISGGTSSGKTTFLNACLQHIPLHERIITIEDTREIDAPHPNQVNLLASKGEQGTAKIDMQTLVQCCLRLRPDRIIIGEIRGKEVIDFISACSTGHEGSLTSIHANSPRIAFMRMSQLYKLNNVPSMTESDIFKALHEIVDVIIQLIKTDKGRKVQGVYYKYGNLKLGK